MATVAFDYFVATCDRGLYILVYILWYHTLFEPINKGRWNLWQVRYERYIVLP